jgi:hypothetical protein
MEDIDGVGLYVAVGALLGAANAVECGGGRGGIYDAEECGDAECLGLRAASTPPTTTVTSAAITIRSILSCYSVFILTVICMDSNSRVYNPIQ